MTDVTNEPTSRQLVKQRHPIRGVLWGLMFGVGLAVVLVLTTVIALDLPVVIAVIAIGTIAGTAWSVFGPAKSPTDDSEAPTTDTVTPAPGDTAQAPPPPPPPPPTPVDSPEIPDADRATEKPDIETSANEPTDDV